MVRIIDGEIVADDDPRVTGAAPRRPAPGPQAGAAPPPRQGAAPAPAPGIFDWNAPPFRLVPDDGQGIGGLPNVRIFGALLRSQHALMLLAAMVLAGPKGLILGAILWWVWLNNQQQQQQPQRATGNQAQRMAAAQQYFTSMFAQGPAGSGSSGGGQGGSGSAGSGAARPAAQDPWAGRGKAHKLSDS